MLLFVEQTPVVIPTNQAHPSPQALVSTISVLILKHGQPSPCTSSHSHTHQLPFLHTNFIPTYTISHFHINTDCYCQALAAISDTPAAFPETGCHSHAPALIATRWLLTTHTNSYSHTQTAIARHLLSSPTHQMSFSNTGWYPDKRTSP